jgi:hypothetical protein
MLRQVPKKLASGMGVGKHGDEEFRYQKTIERSTIQGISRRLESVLGLERVRAGYRSERRTLSSNKFLNNILRERLGMDSTSTGGRTGSPIRGPRCCESVRG